MPPFDLALVLHARWARRTKRSTALERAYEERNALLWYRIHFPMFDPLRGEPRWQALADKLARTAPLKTGATPVKTSRHGRPRPLPAHPAL